MRRVVASDQKARRQRGMALLMVLSMIAVLTSVVVDFQFNSRVDLQRAFNARDGLQAEYNALSALRTRQTLLRLKMMIKAALQAQASLLGLGAAGDLPLGSVLEMIPVECGLLSAIIHQTSAEKTDTKEGSDFFPGECLASMTSEHSKLPLNALSGYPSDQQQARPLWLTLMSDKRLEKFFQEDDKNGKHALNPQELVDTLTDWTDTDKTVASNSVVDEDRFYADLQDSYKPKNAPFDSLAEVQLVHGVSDQLYSILKNHVSIYSNSPKVDLNNIDAPKVWFLLPFLLRPGIVMDQVATPVAAECLSGGIAMAKSMGGIFGMVSQQALAMVLVQCFGAAVDVAKIGQISLGGSAASWFTIEAQGRVGHASSKMRAVYWADTQQLYYMRIE
jgi:hypothetical protein